MEEFCQLIHSRKFLHLTQETISCRKNKNENEKFIMFLQNIVFLTFLAKVKTRWGYS